MEWRTHLPSLGKAHLAGPSLWRVAGPVEQVKMNGYSVAVGLQTDTHLSLSLSIDESCPNDRKA